jgi:rhodanese-related sulfurtransferase/DNA-binding transcriptional ArsR family regulator
LRDTVGSIISSISGPSRREQLPQRHQEQASRKAAEPDHRLGRDHGLRHPQLSGMGLTIPCCHRSMVQLKDVMRKEAVSSRSAAGTVRAALAEVAKALGHAHRIELVEQLAQGPRSVDALATRVGLSVANASQHLQQLRRAGLVSTQRDGKRVVYRLADDAEADIVALIGGLRGVAERTVASMERVIGAYFRTRDELEPVAAGELVTRLREGSVVLLDVRPEDEYGLGHLPGALNIPLRELEARLSELPRTHEIVAYCRGPYCVLSFEAVAALRTHGFNVRRFDEGFPEWKAAGLPIEVAT